MVSSMTKGGKPKVDELNSVGISTAARVLGVSRQAVYNWIASGQLKAHPLPGSRVAHTHDEALRILRTDLERLRRRRERSAQ